MKKRMLSLLLAVIMAISLLPATVLAEEITFGDLYGLIGKQKFINSSGIVLSFTETAGDTIATMFDRSMFTMTPKKEKVSVTQDGYHLIIKTSGKRSNVFDFYVSDNAFTKVVVSGMEEAKNNDEYSPYNPVADYSAVTAALNECKALKASDYTSDSWQALQNAINGVVYDLDADHQADVDAMAKAITDAIKALVLHTTHDFTGAYEDNGNGTHARKCTGCDEYSSPVAHSYTNGECVCGAKDLNSVKKAAEAELKAALADAKCAEAKQFLQNALDNLADAQTVDAVNGIVGDAKDDAAEQDMMYSSKLAGYTTGLDNELKNPDISEGLKTRIQKLKADLAAAESIAKLDELFLGNISDIQLESAKDAAVSEINAAKTDANASIAEAAVTAIGNAQSEDEIKAIKTKALADMKKVDELADAKDTAKKAIDDAVPSSASKEVKAAAEAAKKAIEAATTTDAVKTAKENGLTAIKDQIAADDLAQAKKSAIAAINGYKSDVNASIADAAIADINKATTTTEVDNIANQAIPNMLAAEKKVEHKETIINELLPAAKCDEAKEILKKAYKDLDSAVTMGEVESTFYNAKGTASGKDSEFNGRRTDYTNHFNAALIDVATEETKAFVAEMLQALDEATSIAQIIEIHDNNSAKVGFCINRDNYVNAFKKYTDSDKYSDALNSIAQEAIEKLMQADYKDDPRSIADEYWPEIYLQKDKDEACEEIEALLPDNASDAVKKIVSDACDEIQASDDSTKFESIIEAAGKAVDAQLQKEKELAPAKEAAIAEINDAKTDANASVAEDAVKAINNAQSEDEISTIKEQALADMAAAELAAAKDAAKKAILAEQGNDTSEAVTKAVEDAIAAIEAATTVDAVNAAMEDGIAAIKDAKAGNVPPAPVTYTILDGANSVWTKGSTSGLTVRSDAPFAKFVCVKVDGKIIAATNYTAKEGSTIVTLNSAYLETLETGKHSIEIVSTDGSASTNFTVKAKSQPADPNDPQTGDSSMVYLWTLILVVSAAGLSATTVYSRKRRNK